jgi:hypothetical protein
MHADGSLQKMFDAYKHCLLKPPYKITSGPQPTPNCPEPTE